jgi:hypothetical protein
MSTTLRRSIRDRSATQSQMVPDAAAERHATQRHETQRDASERDASEKAMAGKGAIASEARARRRGVHPNEALPDGVGGTITGGPMQPINLIEILRLGERGESCGGAVSGAAQGAVSGSASGAPANARGARDPGIALSDGSRIIFASVEQASVPDERFLAVSES